MLHFLLLFLLFCRGCGRTLGTASVGGRCFCFGLSAARRTAFRRGRGGRWWIIGLYHHGGRRGLLATCQRETHQRQGHSRHGFQRFITQWLHYRRVLLTT